MPEIIKIILEKKKAKMEDLYCLISGFSIMLRWSRQCGIKVKTGK